MAYKTRQLSPDRRLRFFLFLLWLHFWQIMETPVWSLFPERRKAPQVYYLINDRRRNHMAPTPRAMATVTWGMIGVSVIAWVAASSFPRALYMVPFYFFYVAIILVIKAVRLRRWVVN